MTEGMTTASAPLVELAGASFTYAAEGTDLAPAAQGSPGVQDVSTGAWDIDLCLRPGTVTVLCGRSGEGKSTVLRMVDGLAGTFYPGALEGDVRIAGVEAAALSPEARTRTMGVVLQDPRSQFFMDAVADEIAFSAENLGVDPAEIVPSVRRAARACGVEGLLDDRLSELSSGQKQRVALAAALVLKPRVLILDEPLANLDAAGVASLVGLIGAFKRQGCAVLISEHRLHTLTDVADEYVYIRAGRAVECWERPAFMHLDARACAARGFRHPDTAGDPSAPGEGIDGLRALTILPGGAHSQAAGGSARAAWEVRGLTYRYPSTGRGIADVDARFPIGAVTVLAGPNGCGKSTLAKVLCGAVREQRGEVRRCGARMTRAERRRRSYFVMQDADYQLYTASVAEELVLGRRVDEALAARAREALAAFDLTELAHRHPASLSGGQKQRVTLAAAYCSDAELIVLDEPTSGLDGRGVEEVASWCRTLAAQGKAVVIITHDAQLACMATRG